MTDFTCLITHADKNEMKTMTKWCSHLCEILQTYPPAHNPLQK